eukprot:tig00020829_g14382.t1
MLPRQGTPTNGGAGTERLRELGLLRERRRPQPPPRPRRRPHRDPGLRGQQEAERRALAARQAREAEERRQALWAQRLQATIAFRAELDSGFRAGQIAGRRPRSAGGRSRRSRRAGEGLGYSYRRRALLKDYASRHRRARPRGRRSTRRRSRRRARRPRTTRASGTCTTEARGGVGFGYAAKSLYAPGGASQAAAGMRPAGR